MEQDKPKKAPIDWEAVERDWRAGVKTKLQISNEQGVSRAAMDKRFAKLGVTRDLKGQIQAKADALVTRAQVAPKVTTANPVTEREIVEENAQVLAVVRISHRTDIARFRRLVAQLLEELETETGDIGLFHELGDLLRSEDDKGQDKRNDLYNKVISSAGRVDSLKKLSDTLKVLVALEREAYGIVEVAIPNPAGNTDLLAKLVNYLPD